MELETRGRREVSVDVCVAAMAIGLVAAVLRRSTRMPWWTAGLLAGVLTVAGLWKLSSVRAEVVGPTILHVETDEPLVALTFDDGPTPAYTDAVVDLLAAYDARATFFVTGEAVAAHPELAERLLTAGHQLGNHSETHPRLVLRAPGVVAAQVDRTDALLREVGVDGPIAFRPPYGKRLWDLHRVLGDRPVVLWDVEPESYPDVASDPARLAAHVLDRVEPGSIVLLHVMMRSRQTSRDALPVILEGLRERGLRPVRLDALLAAGRPEDR
jgi:peptidoglycan/xylan/chitin deacetylase (PgdA/CDA1 family)